MLCATHECADASRTRLNRQKTKHVLMSNVEFHLLCVEVDLDLGCHLVIGVVLGLTTQTQLPITEFFSLWIW